MNNPGRFEIKPTNPPKIMAVKLVAALAPSTIRVDPNHDGMEGNPILQTV
jgi:hypothetical protein